MSDLEKALELIKELVEEVGEKGEPLWAWYAVYQIACQALGLCEVSEEGIKWGLAKLEELGFADT